MINLEQLPGAAKIEAMIGKVAFRHQKHYDYYATVCTIVLTFVQSPAR
jgi:hypothetical protein